MCVVSWPGVSTSDVLNEVLINISTCTLSHIHVPVYFVGKLSSSILALIPGRTSSEDGPGIDCLRMR